MHSYVLAYYYTTPGIHRKAVTVVNIKSSKRIWKHVSTIPLLAHVSYERRGMVTAHFHQESQYPDRKV